VRVVSDAATGASVAALVEADRPDLLILLDLGDRAALVDTLALVRAPAPRTRAIGAPARRRDYAVGSTTGWHSHPDLVFITVTQGTLTYYLYEDRQCTPHVVSRLRRRWPRTPRTQSVGPAGPGRQRHPRTGGRRIPLRAECPWSVLRLLTAVRLPGVGRARPPHAALITEQAPTPIGRPRQLGDGASEHEDGRGAAIDSVSHRHKPDAMS
jgi:hypothetical protein